MADENNEATQAEFSQQEVLQIFKQAGLNEKYFKGLLERMKDDPSSFSSTEQLGNALKPAFNSFRKTLRKQAIKETGDRFDAAVSENWSDVDFEEGSSIEERVKKIASLRVSESEEESGSPDITDRQVANHPNFLAIQKENAKLKEQNDSLYKNSLVRENAAILERAINSADFGDKKLGFDTGKRRAKQVAATVNSLLAEAKFKLSQDGKILLGSDGMPVPVNDDGEKLFDISTNKDVGFYSVLTEHSIVPLVDSAKVQTAASQPDFNRHGSQTTPLLHTYPGVEKDSEYLTKINEVREAGNYEAANNMLNARNEARKAAANSNRQ